MSNPAEGPRIDNEASPLVSSRSATEVEADLAKVRTFVNSLNPEQRTTLGDALASNLPGGLLTGFLKSLMTAPNPSGTNRHVFADFLGLLAPATPGAFPMAGKTSTTARRDC